MTRHLLKLPRKSTGSDAVADGARETIDRAVMAELTRQHDAGVKYLSGINVDDLVSAIQSVAPVKAVGSESLRDLLREARQYVSDAGVDDDPETKRNSSSLLSAIDTALAHPTMATHHD